jgi:hypothetical protein
MKTKFKIGLAALGIAGLSAFFQNCSPVKFGNRNIASVDADAISVIRSLQPTLAVRAMGCVQCHAQVNSNLVTDFGYGDSYYFGQKDGPQYWNANSPYGDHGNNFNTMGFTTGQTVYVPHGAAPSIVQSSTGAATLAAYIAQQFAAASTVTTQTTTIQEMSSVYIGAPADSDLINAFNLPTTKRYQFNKSAQATQDLAGLYDQGTFLKNSSTLVCDGDLIVRGPLYLENLQLQTVAGCRIYVVGSVFLFGPITYVNQTATSNLQITSSKAIGMGLGTEVNNGQNCEPSSRYALNTTDPSYARASSLDTRFVDIYTTGESYVRAASDPVAFGNTILAEAALIQNVNGPFLDASCRPETRNVAFSRLLLNAPIIHSRYTGAVSGTIIGEFVMMSLGQFQFSFDPVFNSVDVLPYLAESTFLQLKK